MTQKFEITKGTEADFEGAPDDALSLSIVTWYLDDLGSTSYFCELKDRSRKFARHGDFRGLEPSDEIIAERRPIAEPQPDADGWIEWNGGECPVPKGTLVDVWFRAGLVNKNVSALACGSVASGAGGGNIYWKHDSGYSDTYDIIAYRLSKPEQPAAPAWNGEGLPPVGVECEFFMDNLWNKVKIVAKAKLLTVDGDIEHVIFNYINLPSWSSSYTTGKFRPIRSPEEIEREKAIGNMLKDYEDAIGEEAVGMEALAFQILYDAGYRKVTK